MNNLWAKRLLFFILLIVCPILARAVQFDSKTTVITGKMVSIPERFQSYSGVRNLASLSYLFLNPHPVGVVQLPEIAVADGVLNVEIE